MLPTLTDLMKNCFTLRKARSRRYLCDTMLVRGPEYEECNTMAQSRISKDITLLQTQSGSAVPDTKVFYYSDGIKFPSSKKKRDRERVKERERERENQKEIKSERERERERERENL